MTRCIRLTGAALLGAALAVTACSKPQESRPSNVFATPEDAVKALNAAVGKGDLAAMQAIFGPDSKELVDSSDPATARQNQQVYAAAVAQGWRLDDIPEGKELIIGDERWPFPVPLVKDGSGWRFDTAAGKEEVLDRRIGRNELKAIQICRIYVAAQRKYAGQAHDGKPAKRYAQRFRSEPGTHSGLFWPSKRGEPLSPLGDLMPEVDGRQGGAAPAPFHGYYFKILTAQGAAAAGGARNYVVNGALSGGFALVAWPATYDVTGVTTFVINQDNVVHQKDLGPDTAALAAATTQYDPDGSWSAVK
jgi:hypothetical protein